MPVKKIVISNLTSSTSYWIFALKLFDQDGTEFDPETKVGTTTLRRYESSKVIVTCDKDMYSATANYSLENLMLKNRPATTSGYSLSANKPSTLTIELKTPMNVSKINYVTKYSAQGAHWTSSQPVFTAYDENGLEIKSYTLRNDAELTTGGLDVLTPELVCKCYISKAPTISDYHVYHGEVATFGGASIAEPNGLQVQYKILLNGNKIYPAGEYTPLAPSPNTTANVSIAYADMIDESNTVTIVAKDSTGGTKNFDYKVYRENIAIPSMKRSSEFEDGYSLNREHIQKDVSGLEARGEVAYNEIGVVGTGKVYSAKISCDSFKKIRFEVK